MINKYLHILMCLIILLLGTFFVPLTAADENPPAIPNVFTGTVKINGENAPTGIEVQAYIGNISAGSALVGEEDEYMLCVKGASTDEQKNITFMVGSLTAAETPDYHHETSPRKLNLTILDNEGPKTTSNVPDGWQNSSFTVTLSATDNLGDSFVNATFYKLDEGSFERGNSVEINEDGNHSITYYSEDLAGNVGPEKTIYAKLDTRAPETTVDAPEVLQNVSFWVNFTAEDDGLGSGVKSIFYKFEGDVNPICGNSLYIDKDGNYDIIYYSQDIAGNFEGEKRVHVELDTAAPILKNLAAFPLSILNDSTDISKVSVNVTDLSETGITNVTIDLSPIGGDPGVEMSSSDGLKYTYGITTNQTGEYEFIVTATNNADKSNFDTVNVTVRTEKKFVEDYDSGEDDEVTQEEINEVMDNYRDGNVSDAAAAAVVKAAYPTTYEAALALLGLVG